MDESTVQDANGKASGEVVTYQQLRASNIARNEAFLRGIGLMPNNKQSSSSSSRKRTMTNKEDEEYIDENGADYNDDEHDMPNKAKKLKKNSHKASKFVPPVVDDSLCRRSSRIKNEPPSSNLGVEGHAIDSSLSKTRTRQLVYDVDVDVDIFEEGEDGEHKKRLTIHSLKAFIIAQNAIHAENISDEIIELTVFRVNGMSPKALGTRIKRISRSVKCVCVHLYIFKY